MSSSTWVIWDSQNQQSQAAAAARMGSGVRQHCRLPGNEPAVRGKPASAALKTHRYTQKNHVSLQGRVKPASPFHSPGQSPGWPGAHLASGSGSLGEGLHGRTLCPAAASGSRSHLQQSTAAEKKFKIFVLKIIHRFSGRMSRDCSCVGKSCVVPHQ